MAFTCDRETATRGARLPETDTDSPPSSVGSGKPGAVSS